MMQKQLLDHVFAILALIIVSPILLLCFLIASVDTRSFGIFMQSRIGQYGVPFRIFKLKSMKSGSQAVTSFGNFLRQTKIDELPQLVNIIRGQMSFVGPRPDVPGYADQLTGDDRFFLNLKPGLTSLASLKYRHEEMILKNQPNPLAYNDTVIWPDKVFLNNWYAKHQNFKLDLTILFYTILHFLYFDADQYINQHINNY